MQYGATVPGFSEGMKGESNMPDDRVSDDARREAQESATAWFAVLERARRIYDFRLAAKAVSELERLGIKVKYANGKARGVRNGR